MRKPISPLVTVIALLLAGPAPATAQQLEGQELAAALRGGGYVIFLRHARTDWSQKDAERLRLGDCATQRNLSEAGRAQAIGIGLRVTQLGIPIARVLAGPFCRVRETAERAFGRAQILPELASLERATDAEKAARIAALKRMLATPPPAGTNTVIVGHGDHTQAALDLKLEEGEAAVFLPGSGSSDDGFTLVARIPSWQWHALAKAAR